MQKFPEFLAPHLPQIYEQVSSEDLQYTVFVDTSSSAIRNFLFLMILMSFLAEVLALTLICLILLMLRKNSKKYSKNTYRLHVQLTLVLLAQLMTPILLIIGPVFGFSLNFLAGRPPCSFLIKLGVVLITLYGPTNW